MLKCLEKYINNGIYRDYRMFWNKYKMPLVASLSCIGIIGIGFVMYKTRHFFIKEKPKQKEEEKPEETTLSKDELFCKTMEKKFAKRFDDYENGNATIERVFYLAQSYNKEINRVENTLEKNWKSRIIMEHTPRGNVIMYYDAYKRGFAYYSDTYMPYSLLNACAMKYCLVYFCLDFFIDETYWPESLRSPFQRMHLLDAKKENEKQVKYDFKHGPFAKLKKPMQKELVPKRTPSLVKKQEKMEEKIKNKFVYLGKTCNFQFLKVEKVPVLQKKDLGKMKYSDFKSWHFPVTEGKAENYLFNGGSDTC